MKEPILFCWSSGKDSALALHELRAAGAVEIAALLTTVRRDGVPMHGVPRRLLGAQAASLGHPLQEVLLPPDCPNEAYARLMRRALLPHARRGIRTVAFGDLFLQEVREYREERMQQAGMRCLFPLWGRPPLEAAKRFIGLGFRALVVCVDTNVLPAEFAGREYDAAFLEQLPPGVDPCGENGEFHTFVFDGPIFRRPIALRRGGRRLEGGRFAYRELLPVSEPDAAGAPEAGAPEAGAPEAGAPEAGA